MRQRRLVRGDRAVDVAGLGELDPALQQRPRIVAQRGDGGEHRIGHGRPARAVLRVPLERRLRVVAASERAIRERQRVVRGAELGKERDRALKVRRRPPRACPAPRRCVRARTPRRAPPPGSVSAANSRWLSSRSSRVEQRLGQLHPRRQVVRRDGQRRLEPRGGLGGPGQALQHDRVEVRPLERARRERLRARVGLVRGVPLFPGLQHAAERADRLASVG